MKSRDPLQSLLRSASLHSSILLVSRVLARSGYGDVQLLDRRAPKQKSRLKGCELLCESNVGHDPVRVIVKVVKDSVRTRMLDELAGAVDRTKADFGILVSTEDLPAKARAAKELYRKSRVEVLDLSLLSRMLRQYRIGVRPGGEPDYAFFSELDNQLDKVNSFLSYGRR